MRWTALRAGAFATTLVFAAAVFLAVALPLVIALLEGLPLTGAFAFGAFLDAVFFAATALFALGRFDFGGSIRLLAVDLGEARRAAARDVDPSRLL